MRSSGQVDGNIGQLGEELAAVHLRRCGYTLLERNFRHRTGEIDLVARHGDSLVFIEVKTRKSLKYGTGIEAVDARKQRQISRAALAYLSRHDLLHAEARFDVVSVCMQGGGPPMIEVYQNAFDLIES